jgi:yecA family protein
LLVCPELIKPGEWLPIVWSRDGADPEPAFDSLDHVNGVLGLIMEHYNGVARTLMERPDRYNPLFPVDKRNGDIIWELWIEGFEKAVRLRPDVWQKLLDTDADTATAMRGMLTLADIARGDRRLSQEESEALSATAPDISRAGSLHSMHGGLPITNRCKAMSRYRARPSLRQGRLAAMIPVPAAQERNTRGAADFTEAQPPVVLTGGFPVPAEPQR